MHLPLTLTPISLVEEIQICSNLSSTDLKLNNGISSISGTIEILKELTAMPYLMVEEKKNSISHKPTTFWPEVYTSILRRISSTLLSAENSLI
jgi:hypothetical protein